MLLLTLFPSAAFARPSDEERLDIGGVVKEITIPEGQPWAFVDVSAVIDAKSAVVWGMLTDVERWPKWLPMNRKAKVLAPEAASLITTEIAKDQAKVIEIDAAHPGGKAAAPGGGHWQETVYEMYDLPWPLENEWVVRRYTYDESATVNRAAWKKIDDSGTKEDGYWEVGPREGGRTLLHYYYRVKAKEGVPRSIFKTATSLTVGSMIKALRHEAARRTSLVAQGT